MFRTLLLQSAIFAVMMHVSVITDHSYRIDDDDHNDVDGDDDDDDDNDAMMMMMMTMMMNHRCNHHCCDLHKFICVISGNVQCCMILASLLSAWYTSFIAIVQMKQPVRC